MCVYVAAAVAAAAAFDKCMCCVHGAGGVISNLDEQIGPAIVTTLNANCLCCRWPTAWQQCRTTTAVKYKCACSSWANDVASLYIQNENT